MKKEYIYGEGIDNVISMIHTRGTETRQFWFQKNHQGSVIAVSDGSGKVVESYRYDTFGNIILGFQRNSGKQSTLAGAKNEQRNTAESKMWLKNDRLYTSREYDEELGMYYYRGRHYDPRIGRFIQRDPIGMSDDVNLYRYVGNNPMNYNDPFGLNKCKTVVDWSNAKIDKFSYNRNNNTIGFLPDDALNELASAGINSFTNTVKIFGNAAIDLWNLGVDGSQYGTNFYINSSNNGISSALNGVGSDLNTLKNGFNYLAFGTTWEEKVKLIPEIFAPEDLVNVGAAFKVLKSFVKAEKVANTVVDVGNASSKLTDNLAFAQKTATAAFRAEGNYLKQSVNKAISMFERGVLDPTLMPIDVVIRDGTTLIANTRSAIALLEGGIKPEFWTIINRTGIPLFEDLVSDQLKRNFLTNKGISFVKFLSSAKFGSSIVKLP